MGVSAGRPHISDRQVYAGDKGIVMKRMMPAAMGTGHRINKRTSHLNLLLAEKVLSVKKTKTPKKLKINKKLAPKA